MFKRTRDGQVRFSGPITVEALLVLAANLQLEKMVSERFNVSEPRLAKEYCVARLAHVQSHEEFHAVWLDHGHNVIASERLASGTIDGAAVYPREVVRAALNNNAAAVIFFHNHPGGSVNPSSADIAVTRRLKDALNLVEIRVLDHLIVAGSTVTSMAERGLV